MGHLDIISRAAAMFDEVIVVAMNNADKKYTFTPQERVDMIKKSTADIKNVTVDLYNGLLAEYAAEKGAFAIIKGLRAMSDFEYEFQMALTNRKMAPEIETLFMMPSESLAYVSSSTVREIARYGGDLSGMVTPTVLKHIKKWKPDC